MLKVMVGDLVIKSMESQQGYNPQVSHNTVVTQSSHKHNKAIILIQSE